MINAGETVVCIKQDNYRYLTVGHSYPVFGMARCNCSGNNVWFDLGFNISPLYISCECEDCGIILDRKIDYFESTLFALPIDESMFEEKEENILQELLSTIK